MSVLDTLDKPAIPTYSLLQNSSIGSSMIEVREASANCGVFKLDPAFLIPHRKDYYLFVLVKQGNNRHWIDFMPYTLKPDTFYFTVPHQVHLKEHAGQMEGLMASFTDEFLQLEENRMLKQLPIIQNQNSGHELLLTAHDMNFIEDVMRKMLAEFNADGTWRNQMLTSWLRVLVIYLSRLYTEQFGEGCLTQSYCLLKSFQALIGEHYTTQHDVAAYAEKLNITPGHLTEVVKQQSGKTAIIHIHERLIVEAKRRLLHTELSVKQIADELGFEDAAYFNRFFKRIANTTPVSYREQIREMYS
ncbi:transcriptional regulator, AraC family [Mucilaginibacter sp. OK268]|uniref:helix-turn-helix domain-containing protein n=1 Tax=Mucilaginibacter sp. OK268 TaxID=1881048 RepID=UPI00088AD427|nr:helix-turn-helix domain-containing protein [Mucilaginibacter sp. OK268]SDP58205.1 transcriptional regulator, AraC family [Mucilaginibacter sp. OK268]